MLRDAGCRPGGGPNQRAAAAATDRRAMGSRVVRRYGLAALVAAAVIFSARAGDDPSFRGATVSERSTGTGKVPASPRGGASASSPDQSSPAVGALDSAWDALEPQAPDPEDRVIRRPGSDGVLRAGTSADGEQRPSWMRSAMSLGAVVGLILLLAWGYRAISAGGSALSSRPRRPGLIEVISRTALSPKQAVCLLRVGSRMVLVGVTPERLTALDVVEDPEATARLAGRSLESRSDSASQEFQRCLREQSSRFGESLGAPAGTSQPQARRQRDTDTERRLSAIRAQLGATLQRFRRTAAMH
jgi:flagellar biogenesis protein FliO